MSAASKEPFRVTGRHVFIGVTLFFVIIIALDAWFMALAYRSFPGESATDPYEAGLEYNRTLAKREAEARLGWAVTAEQLNDGVRIRALDAAGQPLSGLSVSGELARPATQQGRKVLELTEVEPGVYQVAGLTMSGAWDFTATLKNQAGAEFEAARRLQWR